jgi:transcription elongation factor Elf1
MISEIKPATIPIFRERLQNMGAAFTCPRCKKEKPSRAGEFYIAQDGIYCMGCVKGMLHELRERTR